MNRPDDGDREAAGTPAWERVPGSPVPEPPVDVPSRESEPHLATGVVAAAAVEPAAVESDAIDPGTVEAGFVQPGPATGILPASSTEAEADDWQVPGWIAPGTPYTPRPRTARELMHALWQTGGQPVLCARRMGCSPRVVLEHIHAKRRHWEEANYSREELFELCAMIVRGAVQKMDRWAVTLVGQSEWGQQALAPLPEPEHQWRETPETPPIQELIPQVLEGLLDERHSIFTRCAARAGGHPLTDGADGVARPVAAGPAPAGDRAGGAGDDLRSVPARAGD